MFKFSKKNLKGTFLNLPMEAVHYGSGSLSNLSKSLESYGIKRALLVTSNSLMNKTKLVEKVIEASEGKVATTFHECRQHVPRSAVIKGAEMARSNDVDGIITFGGGSANDTAKGICIALSENIEDVDSFDKVRIKFEYPDKLEIPSLNGKTLPHIAISTTLSAGEFTYFSGITDEKRKVKDLYLDPQICAKQVILDPDLSLETPLWLWLSTGMRSVDHCIEAMVSSTAHPFTDGLAVRALNILTQYLRETKSNPDDLIARTQCQIAGWMSVCGLANVTLGLSHGIGHQLGARCDVPHGITSCVMMPTVMNYNKDFTDGRLALVAETMGKDVRNFNNDQAADAAIDAVLQLTKDLDQPYRLRDVGVEENDFKGIAKDALEDLIVASNPRPVKTEQEVIDLLKEAY